MMRVNRARRLTGIVLATVLLAGLTPKARAAEPYEINAIVSLTGTASFIGTTQFQTFKVLEGYVNKTGGIGGRPVSFVVADDQSNPQIAVQLAQGLIAKHVPIILGPSLSGTCGAVTPLVAQDGPVLYCLTPAGHPAPGGYAFATLFSTETMLAVALRYFRQRGWHRIAYIVGSDATGQDAERSILDAAAAPENKAIQIVAREHFATTDLSVAAQMALIKAANPDALFAWATGTPAATLFHGEQDAGIDLPTTTSPGNLDAAFLKQFGPILPKSLYFAGITYYGANTLTNAATKSALAVMSSALDAAGAKPNMNSISAWDPTLLLVDALRKLGPDAPAARVRAYLVDLTGWVGANGPYDFRAAPQRGLGENNVIMVKWDAQRNTLSSVSNFGGTPLPGK